MIPMDGVSARRRATMEQGMSRTAGRFQIRRTRVTDSQALRPFLRRARSAHQSNSISSYKMPQSPPLTSYTTRSPLSASAVLILYSPSQ